MNRRSFFALVAALVAAPAVAQARKVGTRESYRYIISPDVMNLQSQTVTHHQNWRTIHHNWMMRMEREFGLGRIEIAHVNSRRYREWLAEGDYFLEDEGIPPHIQFGGAIKAGSGDPTFRERWKAYARQEFGA